MQYAIEIENLVKDYETGFLKKRRMRALDGISLKVEPGGIFGFLGGNGAGKTTTIKILMRLLFPTSGTARILGREITDLGVHRKIGYSPENPYFYDYLTPRELLRYFAEIFGIGDSVAAERIENLLDAVGLEHKKRDTHLRKFSKGMLQRVGLAQALVNDPEVVFLDEPMSGLDPIGRREIRELIASLRSEGKTVFMSTHILADVEALCDQVAILRGGKVAAAGRLDDLLSEKGGSGGVFEIVFSYSGEQDARAAFSSIADTIEVSPTGITVRVAGEEAIAAAIAAGTKAGFHFVSAAPARRRLDDFFQADNP